MCDLYSHSETAHGKSLWIHKKEQKNYPWRFPNQVVGFSSGLSNHKSSSTNRVEIRKPQHMLGTFLWCCTETFSDDRGKYPGTYQIQDTRHQTWPTFEVHSKYILLVFALNTPIIWFLLVRHSFVIVFFYFSAATLDQRVLKIEQDAPLYNGFLFQRNREQDSSAPYAP